MPIKIEITGEHAGDIRHILDALNAPDARLMPLDALLKVTQERFEAAGFGVGISAHAPALAPEDKPTEAEAEAIVEKIEESLATAQLPKGAKGRKAKPAAPAAPDPAPVSEDDKNYVVEEMLARFKDPRQKLKAKAWIDTVTGRHGGVRLSLLPPELFAEIRVEMESEFNIPKKNGGGEAHV